MNTRTAAQRLRDANPVAPGEFHGAATGLAGRAVLQDILASPAWPASPAAGARTRRPRSGTGAPVPLGRGTRARRLAVPAIAAAAITTGAVVIFHGAGAPLAKAAPYHLDAFVTVVPAANPGDAAGVLRRLARSAARQPAPALGPVEYRWYDPATLPTSDAALRQHLMNPPWPHNTGRLLHVPGLPSPQQELAGAIFQVVETEPLPPGVHAAIFRLLAGVAASPGRGYRVVDMGTATDRLGRTGAAIGFEVQGGTLPGPQDVVILIFDPRTGALLDNTGGICKIKMGSIPRQRGNCVPGDYDQYNVIKAVPRLPNFPANLRPLYPGHN